MSDRSPFDYVKSILYTNEYLMVDEHSEGEFIPWVTNRSLSVYADCLFYAQDMNLRPHLSNKMQYDYLFNSIRKTKRAFTKYPNKKNSSSISIIMDAYKYNSNKAKLALECLTEEQITYIKILYERSEK